MLTINYHLPSDTLRVFILLAFVVGAKCDEPNKDHSDSKTITTSCHHIQNDTCPDSDYVMFYLFTRTNPADGQLIDMLYDNITYTFFNASNPTKIIVHGFNSDYNLFALHTMRREYLATYDANIIAVDWAVLSNGPIICYPGAVNNGKHVGRCIADLVQRMLQLTAQDIHMIGFSLGAQVASFAANHLRPYLLPRITGLDPAMPLFITTDNDAKLDASDAAFIDVVHTNAFVQGQIEQSGHVDFYMNGGARQPGCGFTDSGCSHVRAAQYFAESIRSRRGFWGWMCGGYMNYLFGLCPKRPPSVLMGEHVSLKSRGYIIVSTSSSSPFALGPLEYDSVSTVPKNSTS